MPYAGGDEPVVCVKGAVLVFPRAGVGVVVVYCYVFFAGCALQADGDGDPGGSAVQADVRRLAGHV
ncbi:MAG: hypothetical protein A4E55_01220 [Pelotomaculum sp. PtaU1.Bin035]|nr:MAG: hypothetical protein A4E55_01220 [Pelotomaculum sp. PtaU1.Bin035]